MSRASLENDFNKATALFSKGLVYEYWLSYLDVPQSIFELASEVRYNVRDATLDFVFADHDVGSQVLYRLEAVSKCFPYVYSCDFAGVITISYPLVSLFSRLVGVRPVRLNSNTYSYAKKC